MVKVQAIIPSAGAGKRLKAKEVKALVNIDDKPIIARTLKVFEGITEVDSVILVVPKEKLDNFVQVVSRYKLRKVKKIVNGGATRYKSVKNGLSALDKDTKIVMVHDGVRPFVTEDLIKKSANICRREKAVVVAVPVKPTIKKVDKNLYVTETPDRSKLWEIQTPQTFRKAILIKAYKRKLKAVPTDDSSLVEALGVKVKILEGSYSNIKITTKEDLVLARSLTRNGI